MSRGGIPAGKHVCPAKGCAKRISVVQFMCFPHWTLVPAQMKGRVLDAWTTYKMWARADDGSSDAVLKAAEELRAAQREAIEAVAAKEAGAR